MSIPQKTINLMTYPTFHDVIFTQLVLTFFYPKQTKCASFEVTAPFIWLGLVCMQPIISAYHSYGRRPVCLQPIISAYHCEVMVGEFTNNIPNKPVMRLLDAQMHLLAGFPGVLYGIFSTSIVLSVTYIS